MFVFWIPQYEDLLSHFSSMQVAPSSSSQIVPLRSCSNIEQYIHDLDSNSFELDLQFSSEEKRLLLLKQTSGNPWYVISSIHKCVFLLINVETWNRTFWLNIKFDPVMTAQLNIHSFCYYTIGIVWVYVLIMISFYLMHFLLGFYSML